MLIRLYTGKCRRASYEMRLSIEDSMGWVLIALRKLVRPGVIWVVEFAMVASSFELSRIRSFLCSFQQALKES